MSYVSGHYRKGHLRNGRWVSGSYVKGHSRSGFSYGSNLYTVYNTNNDTTYVDSKEDAFPSFDKELNKMLTPQNMKSISEMMENIDNFPYSRALRFFEAYYPYDVEDVHYAEVLLLMILCTSIDELITLRELLIVKIKKMGSVEILDKLPEDLIEELSKSASIDSYNNVVRFQHWTTTIQDNLILDVNSCYDENVYRLLSESEPITDNACGECFINLSNCRESSNYKEMIIDLAKKKANIDVSVLLGKIIKRKKDFEEHWNAFKGFKEGMNGYNAAKLAVEDDLEYLKQFNWRLLPWQKALYSKIDREEVKKRELQAKLLQERKEQRERKAKEKEEKKQKEEERRRKNESRINTIVTVIAAIIVIGIFVALLWGMGEGFIILLLLLLFLKWLYK